jgi:hypothetical protein
MEREITGGLKLFCSPNIFRVITIKNWFGQVVSMAEVMNAHKTVLIKSRLNYEGNTAVNARRLDEK